MEVAFLFAPLYAGALVALVLAALVWGRPQARAHWPSWPYVWGGLLAVGVVLVALRLGITPPIAGETVLDVLGMIALAGGVALAVVASQKRRRAELLIGTAPVALDEAVARARANPEKSHTGVFRARVGGDAEVTSPGGVVCAFYEAELREASVDGRRGRLISTERAFGDVLWIRGERAEVPVSFAPEAVFAPEETRRTTVAGSLAMSSGRAFADGDAPSEAISYEKVGRLGEMCLVAGRLAPGPAEGSFVIHPAAGGAALVVLGEDTLPMARRLVRASWTYFAATVGLFAAAAWLLAG